jgi:hypothetical protein
MADRRPPPFSLRLTFEERAKIEHDAAGMSIGGYTRSRLLDPDWIAPRRRGKFPVKDHRALAQLLAMLGLCNLKSGDSDFAGSRILVIPFDIGLVLAGPFFVDFDEDCTDEAHQAVFVVEDPDFDGASFDLLLDGSLDRV